MELGTCSGSAYKAVFSRNQLWPWDFKGDFFFKQSNHGKWGCKCEHPAQASLWTQAHHVLGRKANGQHTHINAREGGGRCVQGQGMLAEGAILCGVMGSTRGWSTLPILLRRVRHKPTRRGRRDRGLDAKERVKRGKKKKGTKGKKKGGKKRGSIFFCPALWPD